MSISVNETRLWSWLSTARREFRYRLHITRIENNAGSGTPDVEGCFKHLDGPGYQFWIELKTCARPARAETKIKVRFQPTQQPWLKRRIEAGGRAWVLLQVGSGKSAKRYLVWASSTQTKRLAEGLTEDQLEVMARLNSKASACEIIEMAAG